MQVFSRSRKAVYGHGMSAALRRLAARSVVSAGLIITVNSAQAATFHKADNTTALNNAASYTENAVPTNVDTIVFDSTIAGSLSFGSGNANPTFGDFQVLNPGGPLTLALNNTSGSTPGVVTVGMPTGGDTIIDMSAATQDFTINGGTLRFSNVTTTRTFNVAAGRTLTLNSFLTTQGNTQTLSLAGAGNINLNGAISGAGPISLAIGGTNVTLGAANTFTGATTLTTGTLTVGNTNSLLNSTLTDNNATANTVTFAPGLGTANIGGLAGTSSFALADTSGGAVNTTVGANNASTTFSGSLTGTGALIKVGTGTLTESSITNTYSGGTTISGGSLLLNNAANTGTSNQIGTGALTLTGGGILNANGGAGANFNNALNVGAGGGTLLFRKTSTLNFASLTGTDTLTLQIGSGATVSTATFLGYAGTINVTNGSTGGSLRLGLSSSMTFDNSSLSNASLVLNTGANVTRVNGTNGTMVTNIGTLSGTTGSSIGGSIAGSGTFIYSVGARNESSTFSGTVLENNTKTGLAKVGTGTLTLGGTVNSYTGATSVTNGTLSGNAGSFGTSAVTTTGAGTVDYTQSTAGTVNNNITGTGKVTVGANTSSVNGTGGAITYTAVDNASGGTTVTNARLELSHANGGALSGPVTAASGGTVGISSDSQILAGSPVALLANGTLAAEGHSEGAGTKGGTVTPTGALGTLQIGDPTTAATTTLDFGDASGTANNSAGNVLAFADSSGLTWNGTLNIINYTGTVDQLYVGTTANGLTPAQLGQITFNGLGGATQLKNGEVVMAMAAAPEPSGWASMLVGFGVLGGVIARKRRKHASRITSV